MAQKAIVLLSGGLDSATALAWAQKVKKWDCRCLLFDYGQRHRRELRAARALARRAGCPVHVVRFRLPWGGSSLIDRKVSVPTHAPHPLGGVLPNTYVPARNTIFIAFALSWADAIGAPNVVIGANALDYSGYPDCRPAYLRAMQKAGRLGTRLSPETKNRLRALGAALAIVEGRNHPQWADRFMFPTNSHGPVTAADAGRAGPATRADSGSEGFRAAGEWIRRLV